MLLPLIVAAQLTGCDAAAIDALKEARARAEAFDLSGALHTLRGARGCEDAEAMAAYFEGLLAAREAVKTGGTEESLRDVRSAANALSRRAQAGSRRWAVAALNLRAAAAASQYERDEMALYLAEALRIEEILFQAGQPGAPAVSAHELAGDLWLQVHRYDDARRAYVRAAERVGRTSRVRLGLARTAAKLGQRDLACREYEWLLDWWSHHAGSPPEIQEARAVVRECTQ